MKDSSSAIQATLEGVEHCLEEHLKTGLVDLEEDVRNLNAPQAQVRLTSLLPLASCKLAVRNAINGLIGGNGKPLYVCTSWFLRECMEELTATDDEAMLFATGSEIGNLRAIERKLRLEYAEQSQVFVSADSESNRRALCQLKDNGQRLLAWLHSHPGKGPAATNPSSIDKSHQRNLEHGGYAAIGAIFTRDGHVRFFSHEVEFGVFVFGNNVSKLGKELYKLG